MSVDKYGGVAQLGEHRPCKAGVRSSNLLISINDKKGLRKIQREPLYKNIEE